jgi:hypothetical protein
VSAMISTVWRLPPSLAALCPVERAAGECERSPRDVGTRGEHTAAGPVDRVDLVFAAFPSRVRRCDDPGDRPVALEPKRAAHSNRLARDGGPRCSTVHVCGKYPLGVL